MKLYENITIGNFLFSLGYSIRDKQGPGDAAAGSINLLHQTPADQLLGDVLVNFSGVVRLCELKAQGASLKEEKGKHAVFKRVIEDIGFTEISREVL